MKSIYTIGHSNRSIDEFIDLLKSHEIEVLGDIRTYPGSKRHPQFNQVRLARALENAQIRYYHFRGLGGYREPFDDSINTAIKDGMMRGYADHMASAGFQIELEKLLAQVEAFKTTVMCAEANPKQCHRILLSDALMQQNIRVVHIAKDGKTQEHVLSKLAVIENDILTYPESDKGQQMSLFDS